MARRTPQPPPDITSDLRHRQDETIESHAAFLMWVMLAPDFRSLRRVASILHLPESSIRHYAKKREWPERFSGIVAPEQHKEATAASMFAACYARRLDVQPPDKVREFLRVPYDPDTTEQAPDELLPPVRLDVSSNIIDKLREAGKARQACVPPKPKTDEELVAERRAEAERELRRIREMADAGRKAEMAVLKRMVTDPTKMKSSDLRMAQESLERAEARARELTLELRGSATASDSPASQASELARSDRVIRAVASNGDVLAALEEDLNELALIVSTLRGAESNVVPLPVRREG